MKFSVIGHKKIGASVAAYLKEKGFTAVAFYSDNIEQCVDCAVKVGCKAYTNLEMVLDESELIILAVEDVFLKNVMRKIASYKINDKIFLTLSYAQTSDTISIGSENTYFSAFIPKVIQNENLTDLSDAVLFIEGMGKKFWDLYDEFYVRDVNFKIIDKTKKHEYNIAASLVSDLIFTFCRLADNVLGNAKGEIKNVESFAYNAISHMFDKNHSVEKADFGHIVNNLSFVNSDSAKKIESIYKVLGVMSNGIKEWKIYKIKNNG